MATFYRTGVETYSIIGTAGEMDDIPGGEERIPDGSTYFAVDENMFYTFYDGTWYETLPEAARLYHDDVGTDTKPIKLVGGVATVVANELAEDSKVVHNTGNETVAGIKTFTSNVTCNKLSPLLSLKSTYPNTSINTYKGVISVTDLKDGAESNIILAIEQSKSDCEEMMVRHYKPDRSGYHTLYLRAYQDHHLAFGVPYYPVDGSSNPQAIPTSAVMLSGNIAVDPRIVHTTGNETVAGNKTFSGTVYFNNHIMPMSVFVSSETGWTRLYEIAPHQNTGNIHFVANSAVALKKPTEIQLYMSGSANSMQFIEITKDFDVRLVAARRASDGRVEIWGKGTWASWSITYWYRHNIMLGDKATSADAPVVGDTYNLVASFNVD